jgi:uncharacterized membrane protein YkoI
MNKLTKRSTVPVRRIGIAVAAIVIVGALGWKAYDMWANRTATSTVSEVTMVDITPTALTGLKDAIAIATTAVANKPGVTVAHIELEQGETGPMAYKMLLSNGTIAVYNAQTGGLIKSAPSTQTSSEALPNGFTSGIGFARAVEIARAKKPGSRVYKVELELEGGVVVYSVRFSDKARVDVNMQDGMIVRTKAAQIKDTVMTTYYNSGSGANSNNSDSGSSDDSKSSSSNSGSSNNDGLSVSDDDDRDDSIKSGETGDNSDNSGSGKNR